MLLHAAELIAHLGRLLELQILGVAMHLLCQGMNLLGSAWAESLAYSTTLLGHLGVGAPVARASARFRKSGGSEFERRHLAYVIGIREGTSSLRH